MENGSDKIDEKREEEAAYLRFREIFADLIDGRVVKRAVHYLGLPGLELTDLFVQVLQEKGYLPLQVREIDIQPGERVPAFLVRSHYAYFGWVFWEKFTERKMRKLFGSVARNGKGDWAVQIPEGKTETVFANRSLKSEMDIDKPSGI